MHVGQSQEEHEKQTKKNRGRDIMIAFSKTTSNKPLNFTLPTLQ